MGFILNNYMWWYIILENHQKQPAIISKQSQHIRSPCEFAHKKKQVQQKLKPEREFHMRMVDIPSMQ
jgi:hypothetical protein